MSMVSKSASVESLLKKELAKQVKRSSYGVRLRSASDKLIEKMKKVARRKNGEVQEGGGLCEAKETLPSR